MKHSPTLRTILFALFLLLGFLANREFLQVNFLTYVKQQTICNSWRFIAFLAFCALSLALLSLAVRATWKGAPFLPVWLVGNPVSARQVQTAHGCPGDSLSGDLHAAPLIETVATRCRSGRGVAGHYPKKIGEATPSEEILFIDHRQLLNFNFIP